MCNRTIKLHCFISHKEIWMILIEFLLFQYSFKQVWMRKMSKKNFYLLALNLATNLLSWLKNYMIKQFTGACLSNLNLQTANIIILYTMWERKANWGFFFFQPRLWNLFWNKKTVASFMKIKHQFVMISKILWLKNKTLDNTLVQYTNTLVFSVHNTEVLGSSDYSSLSY